MAINISVSTDEFEKMRLNDWLYVDKTHLIKEVVNSGEVNLITRPRRFGKTLNMTMLREFFDDTKDSRGLFEGLAISHDSEAMRHCNAYPTLFLTFKDLIATSWDECLEKVTVQFSKLAATIRPHLKPAAIDPLYLRDFEAVYERKASPVILQGFLKLLTELLFLSKNKRVVILIDEYDAPIHDGYQYNYYPKVVTFFRQLLGQALKTNTYLERAVLTGILRVAKESIFSGLNNLVVNTVLDRPFSTCFGFTEDEVKALLKRANSPCTYEQVSKFYNGYRFGQIALFNPWSILRHLDAANASPALYWVATSSNQLIQSLIEKRSAIEVSELDTLLGGGTLSRKISGGVSMAQLDAESVWGLFLYSGYLTAESWDPQTELAELRIPNEELKSVFRDQVTHWLGTSTEVNQLSAALLEWDFKTFQRHLSNAVARILSVRDLSEKEPEKTYHVFVVGLLAHLDSRYEVRSNREAGTGYFDLALIPRQASNPGFVFEFKRGLRGAPAAAVSGLEQIAERGYLAAMQDRQVKDIAAIGIAFEGKKVHLAVRTIVAGVETSLQSFPESPGLAARDRAPHVFISAAREDERFVKQLVETLRGYDWSVQNSYWSGGTFETDQDLMKLMQHELAQADIAVLMVSPAFLASDYIRQHELPELLTRAERGELRIVPISVRPSDWLSQPFSQFQSPLDPNKPLAHLRGKNRDWAFVEIGKHIKAMLAQNELG